MKKLNLLVTSLSALLVLASCNAKPAECESCKECDSCESCKTCDSCEVCESCPEVEDNGFVVDYEIAADANVFWTGKLVDGKPEGVGKLVYGVGEEGNTVFTGVLNEDWSLKYGRYRYGNNMYYEGSFEHVDDGVGNYGRFTWSTTGDFRDGNTYIGGVTWNGKGGFDNQNQVGTTYTPAYWKWKDGTLAAGTGSLLYWHGDFGGRGFGFAGRVGAIGQGAHSWSSGIYEGDLECGEEWAFTRAGHGVFHCVEGKKASAWIVGWEGPDYDVFAIDAEWAAAGEFKGGLGGNAVIYLKDTETGNLYYITGNYTGKINAITRVGDATSEQKMIYPDAVLLA